MCPRTLRLRDLPPHRDLPQDVTAHVPIRCRGTCCQRRDLPLCCCSMCCRLAEIVVAHVLLSQRSSPFGVMTLCCHITAMCHFGSLCDVQLHQKSAGVCAFFCCNGSLLLSEDNFHKSKQTNVKTEIMEPGSGNALVLSHGCMTLLDSSSETWFFSELDDVMFQIAVIWMSLSLCVLTSGISAHSHDACAVFMPAMSFILQCNACLGAA